jgi:hypothetical protein
MASLRFACSRNFTPMVLLILTLGLSACASGAKPGAMFPPNTSLTTIGPNSSLREAVAIGQVSGGNETNPLWLPDVSSNEFAEALRLSLAARGMFTRNNDRFRLEATLISLDRPMAGINLTVTSKIRYYLTRFAENAVVFDLEIVATSTANFGAHSMFNERLRLANEGAIRENIAQFLTALIAAERENPQAFGRTPPPRTS